MNVCAYCDVAIDWSPLYVSEEYELYGPYARTYCSVRCVENAIEAAGMAAAKAALR